MSDAFGSKFTSIKNGKFIEAVAIDVAYAELPVVHVEDAWGGDPRDMPDEDLAFFELVSRGVAIYCPLDGNFAFKGECDGPKR